jgi:hypothetical protein
MRGLLLFSVWLAVALAVDAYAFDGQYRRAFLSETHRFTSQITHRLTGAPGAPVDAPTLRPFQGVNPFN